MGVATVDIVAELRQTVPMIVLRIMKFIDDPALRSFSLVSSSWKMAVKEHQETRRRLQIYEEKLLALKVETRENTPVFLGEEGRVRRRFSSSAGSPLMRRVSQCGECIIGDRRLSSLECSFISGHCNTSVVADDSAIAMATPETRSALKPVQLQASCDSSNSNLFSNPLSPKKSQQRLFD